MADYRRGGRLMRKIEEEVLVIAIFGLFWLSFATILRIFGRPHHTHSIAPPIPEGLGTRDRFRSVWYGRPPTTSHTQTQQRTEDRTAPDQRTTPDQRATPDHTRAETTTPTMLIPTATIRVPRYRHYYNGYPPYYGYPDGMLQGVQSFVVVRESDRQTQGQPQEERRRQPQVQQQQQQQQQQQYYQPR
ncbi:hypothetical protein FRB99_007890 [Tulasnella sp. 403]|nr:hypothetical protein FRB99_007890 [Tulasnella sp. 403]